MSSRGKKLAKTEKEARRRQRDAQELDKLVKATAATFRSSYETGEDCAAECEHRRADLLADLDYRRLPYEIWRGRPGAEVLVSAMADLIAENERHLAAIAWPRAPLFPTTPALYALLPNTCFIAAVSFLSFHRVPVPCALT